MGKNGTGDEAETQEEEEDDDEQDDFVSQPSLNSSTHKNGAPTNKETRSSDRFGVVRTINKTKDASQQSREFVTFTNSEVQPGDSRNTGLSNPTMEPEADYEKTTRQRGKTRVSTSTKLPGTNRVTPPLVTPLVDERASIEEALTSIVDSIGEQNEQMSLRMSGLERASTLREKACGKRSTATDKRSEEVRSALRRGQMNTWPKTCRE